MDFLIQMRKLGQTGGVEMARVKYLNDARFIAQAFSARSALAGDEGRRMVTTVRDMGSGTSVHPIILAFSDGKCILDRDLSFDRLSTNDTIARHQN